VLHLAGAGNEGRVRDAWHASGVDAVVLGFLDAMEDAYLAADVAVARSGASSVAELAIAGVPSVFVPLPTLRRGDQEANARLAERAGGAVVVMQSRPDFVEAVSRELTRLLTDAAARSAMGAAARTFARPDAAQRLADLITLGEWKPD